jgi:hypothetical protein
MGGSVQLSEEEGRPQVFWSRGLSLGTMEAPSRSHKALLLAPAQLASLASLASLAPATLLRRLRI